MQGYLWDDNQSVVEWLGEQLENDCDVPLVLENIRALQRDAAIKNIRQYVHLLLSVKQFCRRL